jgi:hypothetical protein
MAKHWRLGSLNNNQFGTTRFAPSWHTVLRCKWAHLDGRRRLVEEAEVIGLK